MKYANCFFYMFSFDEIMCLFYADSSFQSKGVGRRDSSKHETKSFKKSNSYIKCKYLFRRKQCLLKHV